MHCMRPGHAKMSAMETMMGLGAKLGTLMAVDASVAAALAPDGLMAAFQDPSKLEGFEPAVVRGMGALFHHCAKPGNLYAGTPIRIDGRAIGTFCCLYDLPAERGELDDARKALQIAKAERVAKILVEIADTSGAGSPMRKPKA